MKRLVLFFLLVTALRLFARDYYVAPTGNDTNAGTIGAPFATITKARDTIRALKTASGLPAEGINVWLRAGFHDLTATIAFDNRDSGSASAPILYAAYPGEDARVAGSRRLDPTWFSVVDNTSPVWNRIDAAARGQLLVANLPAHGISNYGTLKERGYYVQQIAPLTLFWDGQPMTLGRWPNGRREFAFTETVVSTTQCTYTDDRASRWTQAEELWMHGMWAYHWADFHRKVSAINTTTRTITLATAPGRARPSRIISPRT